MIWWCGWMMVRKVAEEVEVVAREQEQVKRRASRGGRVAREAERRRDREERRVRALACIQSEHVVAGRDKARAVRAVA